jgi:hypothetical protein
MFVKPAPRSDDPSRPLVVRLCHARHRFLSPLGEEVPETQDWHRALTRGDVVRATPAAIESTVDEGAGR